MKKPSRRKKIAVTLLVNGLAILITLGYIIMGKAIVEAGLISNILVQVMYAVCWLCVYMGFVLLVLRTSERDLFDYITQVVIVGLLGASVSITALFMWKRLDIVTLSAMMVAGFGIMVGCLMIIVREKVRSKVAESTV